MDKENRDSDDVAPGVEKRWLWLKSQRRELSTKLHDLQAEFRAIADRLRGPDEAVAMTTTSARTDEST
jgi:hypothetical protein